MIFVQASYDYHGSVALGQLRFRAGTILQVEHTQSNPSGGWLLGTIANDPGKRIGWFPASYVQPSMMPSSQPHPDLLSTWSPNQLSPHNCNPMTTAAYASTLFPDILLIPEVQQRDTNAIHPQTPPQHECIVGQPISTATGINTDSWMSPSSSSHGSLSRNGVLVRSEAWPANNTNDAGFDGEPMGGTFSPGKNSGYGEKVAADETSNYFTIRVNIPGDHGNDPSPTKNKKEVSPRIRLPKQGETKQELQPHNLVDNAGAAEESDLRVRDMWAKVRGKNADSRKSKKASNRNTTTYIATTNTTNTGGTRRGSCNVGQRESKEVTTTVTTVQGPPQPSRGERVAEGVGTMGVYHAAFGVLYGRPDQVVRGAAMATGGFMMSDHMKQKQDREN